MTILSNYSYDNVPYPVKRTPYHLTPEQVQFFDDNGYLILRNRIPQDLLNRLREAADDWIRQGHNYQGQPNNDDSDYDDSDSWIDPVVV
jgi:hypothetical protein